TRSPEWRRACGSRDRRRSKRRSSAACRPGRTGSSPARTRPARRVRSPSTARPGSAPSSIGGAPERRPAMSTVSLNDKIPNNVDLSSDKRLQRALEQWQPGFLAWWKEMGPDGFQACDAYLRTAISVDAGGWAHFDYVKMPDYRWGIFLADPEKERKIGF